MIPIRLRNVLLIVLLLLLGACKSLGFTEPQTLDQKLAYAEGQVTAGYQAVADLATRKRISKETGTIVIGQLDTASTALKTARIAVGEGKLSDANAALATATQILLSVEATLNEAKK